eukprot:jgi/Ulvmu1/6112/UM027_0090.1
MYRRDFGVILLSIFALYWSLQHEGAYEYKEAFFYKLRYNDELGSAHYPLPRPVVADLNGDGANEVLLVSDDLELHLVEPALATRFETGFSYAKQKGQQVIELPSILLGRRRPLALAAGFLDPPPQDFVHVKRKMVVVVVTAGWVVVCLDHNLNVMWQTSIHERLPRHAATEEIAVHISAHKVKEDDRGMVIVGGALALGMHSAQVMTVDDDGDVIDEELRQEEDADAHSHSEKGTPMHNLDTRQMQLSRSFQLYAFEGASGEPRWRNADTDFRKDLDELEQQTIPQHNYRLDAASLEGKRFGEVSCREYREAVLRNLPHSWSRMSDTLLREAYFAKHRAARQTKVPDKPADRAARSMKERVRAASEARAEVRVEMAQQANALVAHTEEGMTIVNLFNGRPICTLSLVAQGYHADINGDGVLDHAIAVTDATHGHTGHHLHRYLSPCSGYTFTGYPPKAPLFNGTICTPTSRSTANAIFAAHNRPPGAVGESRTLLMEAPPPIALPAAPTKLDASNGADAHTQRRHPVYLTSLGDLTMYDHVGTRRWQRRTQATWANAAEDATLDRVAPTLQVLPMRRHAVPTAILAAGVHTAVVYNAKGEQLNSFELPGAPLLPLVQCDFAGHGLTDVLLVTKDGVYGFQLVKNMGAGMPYATMLGGLLVAVVAVFVTQQGPLAGQKIRSTDRID